MSAAGGLRAWLTLVRAPAVFTAVSNIVAAALVADGWDVPFVVTLAIVASASMYLAGMILNDCFDVGTDAVTRPGRPLPSGRISLRAAWLAGWTLLAAGPLLAMAISARAAVVAALLAAAIVAYDGIVRRTAIAPLVMGLCRALNWLFGLTAVGASAALAPVALPVFAYVSGLTWLGTVEADARSRLPLAIALVAVWLAVACLAALVAAGLLPNAFALVPAVAAASWLSARLLAVRHNFTPAAIQGLMRIMILGIVPLDALVVLASGHTWGALLVLALMLPARLLSRAMAIT